MPKVLNPWQLVFLIFSNASLKTQRVADTTLAHKLYTDNSLPTGWTSITGYNCTCRKDGVLFFEAALRLIKFFFKPDFCDTSSAYRKAMFMSREEIKYEIGKLLDHFSEKALTELLAFLKEFDAKHHTEFTSKSSLIRILTEGKDSLYSS